ncbi:MAG: family 43 glycosylhydrolase [Bacteroidales bacterium]
MPKIFIYLSISVFLTGWQADARGAEDTLSDLPVSEITSGNPIITHIRCADPSAEVWNDGQVWIYASHDLDDATDYSRMDGYHAFSSYDLVHWTDHGEILHSSDVSWGNPDGGWMFAPDAAFKDGTYYLYFPTLSSDWKWRIGVATSDKPEGPFTDIGHYIEGPDQIDPTCFMDDDGQAYLMWGGDGQVPKMARLKENMIELAEAPRPIEYGAENFGEGGYMHKRNGIYYFSYTCNTCWPYQGFYATADNPYGPFEYRGELKRIPPGAQDHHSMIEYHGQWYYFYHVGNYGTDGSAFRRNICIDSLYYNEDGTMKEVVQTSTGVGIDPIGMTPGEIVPGRVEAEDYFRQMGITSLSSGDTAVLVTQVEDGDWVEYVLEILGSETYGVRFGVSEIITGTSMALYVDDQPVTILELDAGFALLEDSLFLYRGKHTLRLEFSNPGTELGLLNLDWMEFSGDTEYFSIHASVSDGGTVTPEGMTYYAMGTSATFQLEPAENFVLDTLWVDDSLRELSGTYVFEQISEHHTLQAHFSHCQMAASSPYVRVDEGEPVNGTNLTVMEGSDVTLWVEHDDPLTVAWSGPGGLTGSSDTISLDRIRATQGGEYTCTLVNNQGCMTEYSYQLTVNLMELEVYEAESFISQSGVRLESCADWGGGKYVGAIGDGDWCHYLVNIKDPGYYAFTARVASGSAGGNIEISTKDSLAGILDVDGNLSGGWENWITTEPLEIPLGEGTQVLQFLFSGGEGPLFNFNWFDLQFSRPFELTSVMDIPVVDLYPNPLVSDATIAYTVTEPSRVDLQVINSNGSVVRSLLSGKEVQPGTYTLSWNTGDHVNGRLPGGVYFIRYRCNNTVITKIAVLISAYTP